MLSFTVTFSRPIEQGNPYIMEEELHQCPSSTNHVYIPHATTHQPLTPPPHGAHHVEGPPLVPVVGGVEGQGHQTHVKGLCEQLKVPPEVLRPQFTGHLRRTLRRLGELGRSSIRKWEYEGRGIIFSYMQFCIKIQWKPDNVYSILGPSVLLTIWLNKNINHCNICIINR